MPAASIDFALAASAMVLLTVGAMYGENMVAEPFLDTEVNDLGRHYQMGRYMLLSQGDPADWGTGEEPTGLGFAAEGDNYELDIDKISRLNPSNAYAVNYTTLWEALNVEDVSFRIGVETLFDISLGLTSAQNQGAETVYNFSASTSREGYPLASKVSYYVAVRDSIYSAAGTTDDDGTGTVEFTLPNSKSGTALLVGIARIDESIVSYDVLPFAHVSGSPDPSGTYATLSPKDFTLHVDLDPDASILNAAVFSLDFTFNLTAAGLDYEIPRLLDPGPMILVLTGSNASAYWAEWVAYPQVPLEMGSDMSADQIVSDVNRVSYVVVIEGARYRCSIEFRSPKENE